MQLISFITEFLVGIYLDVKDVLHWKRVSRKEKKDGVKRPIEKHILTPSFFVYLKVSMILLVFFICFTLYQAHITYPNTTKKELVEISNYITQWQIKFEKLPDSLGQVIGNDPMKQAWKTDAWKRPYLFSVSQDGEEFVVISAGKDGEFNTEDDIESDFNLK